MCNISTAGFAKNTSSMATAKQDIRSEKNATHSRQGTSKKSVQFHRRPWVHIIPNVDDYSDDEYIASWYLAGEGYEMKEEIVQTVFLMRSGAIIENTCSDKDDHCTRGLERHSEKYSSRTIKQTRKRLIDSVMIEQEKHRGDITLPLRVATASIRASAASRRQARERAASDAEYAESSYKMMRPTSTQNCVKETATMMKTESFSFSSPASELNIKSQGPCAA